MSKEITYKVKLEGSDGKEYCASASWVANWLSLPSYVGKGHFEWLMKNFNELQESYIAKVLTPEMKVFLLDFLKEPKTTRQLNMQRAVFQGLLRLAYSNAWNLLSQEDKIEDIPQGKGKQRLWRLKPND